jgi:hypothetical protein
MVDVVEGAPMQDGRNRFDSILTGFFTRNTTAG